MFHYNGNTPAVKSGTSESCQMSAVSRQLSAFYKESAKLTNIFEMKAARGFSRFPPGATALF